MAGRLCLCLPPGPASALQGPAMGHNRLSTIRRQDQVVPVGLQVSKSYGLQVSKRCRLGPNQQLVACSSPQLCRKPGTRFWVGRDGCRRGESLSTANCNGECCRRVWCSALVQSSVSGLLPAIVVVEVSFVSCLVAGIILRRVR
jgi:hypothetical protein